MAPPKKWQKKWGGKKSTSQVVKNTKDIKSIKKRLVGESHIADTGFAAGVDYNGTIVPLTAIAGGTLNYQRVGDNIRLSNLNLRYGAIMDPLTIHTNLRILVFRDNMNLGTIPAVTDVLQVAGSSIAPLSHLYDRAFNEKRFTVLYDKMHQMSNTGTNGFAASRNIKLNSIVNYMGPLSTDEGKGQIFLLFVTNMLANLPLTSLRARLSYYDN